MVDVHFAETARVLRLGGHFVILNYSYSGDDTADIGEVSHLARAHGFIMTTAGERPFLMWDGMAFHLRKGTDKNDS